MSLRDVGRGPIRLNGGIRGRSTMGMYDGRCMVSCVSLKGADAALVLLQQSGDAFHPMELAITGNYNRLGSIDGLEDANTQLVFDYFQRKLASGEFVVDVDYLSGHEFYPIDD